LCLVLLLSEGDSAGNGPGIDLQYLSGTDNENTVTWDFYCTGGRQSGYWTNIEVPSCWEQQGFGTYNYGRDYVTYGRKFRFADEQGKYRYSFSVPPEWEDRKVNIVFEGSMTDTEVKINGKPAGDIHQGSFYRFLYDITGLLNPGEENLLEVTVSKMSAERSVNSAERYADYWIFGGIFRPVYLEAYPEEHISQVKVWGLADGSFHSQLSLENVEAGTLVEAEIIDADGNPVGQCSTKVRKGDVMAELETSLDNPLLWNSETPNMYSVKFSLRKGKNILYETEEKFGFRTVEIRHGDGIYLNGTKIKMKGINRHAFWPETGRTLSREIDLMDVKMMKEMNMNAIRCSHYPPDKSFLEICDSLGLYVLDELAGWQNAYSTEAGSKLVKEMVLRDLNHPSIIFWSNGNEEGTNKELDDDFLQYDPSGREVVHCHHKPGNDFNGIETNHYESYESFQKILQDSLIYMCAEYLHGQNDGGMGAGLYDYWELMYSSDLSGGGVLWALVDEGLVRTDWNAAIDVNLVNAPDGVLGPHREKEGSYWAMREIFSPVVMDIKDLLADFSGDLPIENRYFFTNLDQCSFTWNLIEFPAPSDILSGHTVLKSGEQNGPSLNPGEKGKIHIDLPADWKDADALRLVATDQHGEKILEWTWRTREQSSWLNTALSSGENPAVEVKETDSTINLSANDISITLSKITGELTQVRNNRRRRTSFRNGPVLCAGTSELESIEQHPEGDKYHVNITYSGDMKSAEWVMHPSGWVELTYSYSLSGSYNYAGISFDFEEGNVISARWLGNGPYRVWKNRMLGGTLDVWEKAYNNTMAGSFPWNFPEFKGYHSEVNWMELNTIDGKILMVCKENDLFLRLFEFYAFPEPTISPRLPTGDISFMDAIPPIGTKMSTGLNASARSTGPQGYRNELDDTFTHTLYFNFGILPNRTR